MNDQLLKTPSGKSRRSRCQLTTQKKLEFSLVEHDGANRSREADKSLPCDPKSELRGRQEEEKEKCLCNRSDKGNINKWVSGDNMSFGNCYTAVS